MHWNNLMRQCHQLETLDPAAAKAVKRHIKWGFYESAAIVAAGALERILANTTDSDLHRLWAIVVATADKGKTPNGDNLGPALKGRQLYLGKFKGNKVFLYCGPDEQWRLARRFESSSAPIIMFGRDDGAISAPQTGKWKLTLEARQNFERWTNASVEDVKWEKNGGMWEQRKRLRSW